MPDISLIGLSENRESTSLDNFIEFYNLKRSHQGYRLKARTPAPALREALGRKKLPPVIPKENETTVAQTA